MTPDEETKRTTLRLPAILYDTAVEKAQEKRRSFNQYMVDVLFAGVSPTDEHVHVEELNRNQLLGFISGGLLSLDLNSIDLDGVSKEDAEKVVFALVDHFRSMHSEDRGRVKSSSPSKNPTDDP